MGSSSGEHRLVDTSLIQVKPFGHPFSSFDWVDKHYSRDNFAIRRLFSLGRSQSAKTLLVEKIKPTGMIAEENEEIKGYLHGYSMPSLIRISFWKTSFETPSPSVCRSQDCIGYAILKHDRVSTDFDQWHVFEAVFTKNPHPHNCVANPTDYKVKLGGVSIEVKGVLYAQQNELNKTCAQVAMRSVLSNLIKRDISCTEINDFARKATRGTFNPSDGLKTIQIRAVLEAFKIRFLDFDYSQHNYRERSKNPYQKYVYAGVESGSGALLGFSLKGPAIHNNACHIIPFYGHTFNQDTWAPEADMSYFRVGEKLRYVSSVNWTSSFLGHDDNFGPNFCVPRLYISPRQVRYVVELLKPKVMYGGAQAEAMSLRFLYSVLNYGKNSNVWWNRLAFYTHPDVQRVILRALSIDREKYIQHLATEKDSNGNSEGKALLNILSHWLPKNLWVVEISIPQLFPANERKLGEIVLNAEVKIGVNHGDRSHFLLARLPSVFYFSRGNRDFMTIPSGFTSHIQVMG